MPNVERTGSRHRFISKSALGILICVALLGTIALAQKRNSERQQAVTLADLGVTAAQQAEIKALWELKRRKQIQAVDHLKTLNRLVRDSLAEDIQIQETLDKFRLERKEIQGRIDAMEEKLVQALPPRAELHLTVLGVLDNGIPRKMTTSRTRKQTNENSTSSLKEGEK